MAELKRRSFREWDSSIAFTVIENWSQNTGESPSLVQATTYVRFDRELQACRDEPRVRFEALAR